MSNESEFSVLLDTSFLIRLLNKFDSLNKNARDYYQYFLDRGIPMCVSTISIAEYCVKGDVSDLPLSALKILPFNFIEAKEAGILAGALFKARNGGLFPIKERLIISNDTQLFAQANCAEDIKYFVTSDKKSAIALSVLSESTSISFKHLDISQPPSVTFGELF